MISNTCFLCGEFADVYYRFSDEKVVCTSCAHTRTIDELIVELELEPYFASKTDEEDSEEGNNEDNDESEEEFLVI